MTEVNIDAVVRLCTTRDKLARAELCFDSTDLSKFHSFLRRLEHALGSDATTPQKLEVLKLATSGFIRDRIQSAAIRFEDTALEGYGRVAPANYSSPVNSASSSSGISPSSGDRSFVSPLKTGRKWIVPQTLDYKEALGNWADLKRAILAAVLGQEGRQAAETAIETYPRLLSLSEAQRHAYDFKTLVADYLDQNGDRGQTWLAKQFLRTLPRELVRAIGAQGSLPVDFPSAMEISVVQARHLVEVDGLTGDSRQGPTRRPGVSVLSAKAEPSEVSPLLDQLRLARTALRVAGHVPCERGLASMTREDYEPLHTALKHTLPRCTTKGELVASIHQLLPKSWKRTSRHVTETTGEWDLDPSISKDDLARSFAMSRYVSSLKRPQAEEEDNSDEEPPPPPPKKRRPRSAAVCAETNSAWESNFAIRDIVCALSDTRVKCHNCKEPHLVRVCPKLLKKDGSYEDFCAYCGQSGHLCGKLREPTCPVLQKTVCPGCDNLGHTFDFCPGNTCATCDKPGHTSLVCNRRLNGRY
jgi:hypothetical protein